MAKWRTPSLTKKNLSFITKHSLKTSIEEIKPSDVVRLVRSFMDVELYCTDIESITSVPGGYLIRIHPDCPVCCGKFKIKYRKYIT